MDRKAKKRVSELTVNAEHLKKARFDALKEYNDQLELVRAQERKLAAMEENLQHNLQSQKELSLALVELCQQSDIVFEVLVPEGTEQEVADGDSSTTGSVVNERWSTPPSIPNAKVRVELSMCA